MTRGEAKHLIGAANTIRTKKKALIVSFRIIDNIYDDFENRICANCKYYRESCNICINLNLGYISPTFGCNQFNDKNV